MVMMEEPYGKSRRRTCCLSSLRGQGKKMRRRSQASRNINSIWRTCITFRPKRAAPTPERGVSSSSSAEALESVLKLVETEVLGVAHLEEALSTRV